MGRRATAWVGAVALGLSLLSGGTAHAATPTVTLKVSPDPVAPGWLAASGVASGTEEGDTVYIEYRKPSGRWGRALTAEAGSDGSFRRSGPSPQPGRTLLRAKVLTGAGYVTSPTATTRLEKVFALTIENSASSRYGTDVRTGVIWLRPAAAGRTAQATWGLGGVCSALSGKVRIASSFPLSSDTVRDVSFVGTTPTGTQTQTLDSDQSFVSLATTRVAKVVQRATSLRVSWTAITSTQVGLLPTELTELSVLCSGTPPLDDFT